MTQFNSNYDETYPITDTSARFALAANTAQSYTVPGANNVKYRAIFSYASNSNVIVALNKAATVPAAGTSEATTNMEYKPEVRYVKGGDVISIITPDVTAYCGVSLWTLPA